MDINQVHALDGGARLYAIAQLIGDPENSYEIKSGSLELGDLEPYKRFILDNRSCWNALRLLPSDQLQTASMAELKSAYASLTSLCDGQPEWEGDPGERIEALPISDALDVITLLSAEQHEPISVSTIPEFVSNRRCDILSMHIRRLADGLATRLGFSITPHYHASFAVDVRTLTSRQLVFFAIPFFYLGAMTTLEGDITAGLDMIAMRNSYRDFDELKLSLAERFTLSPSQWCDASEATAIELSGHNDLWEKLTQLRRLVRRYRYTVAREFDLVGTGKGA